MSDAGRRKRVKCEIGGLFDQGAVVNFSRPSILRRARECGSPGENQQRQSCGDLCGWDDGERFGRRTIPVVVGEWK